MIAINRKEELQKVFSELDESAKQIVFPMIDDVVFLEKQLAELKKYPFISINPANKAKSNSGRKAIQRIFAAIQKLYQDIVISCK